MKIEIRSNLKVDENDGYWVLQLWVSSSEESADPAIFVYQKRTPMPYDSNVRTDEFSNIASRADMEEYPANDPVEEFAFFRKRMLNIKIESPMIMRDTINSILGDLKRLTDSYKVIK